jgi:hypothetical protein
MNEDKYVQSMEIKIEDMQTVVMALMKAGYQVLCWQDGESMEVVVIEYIDPKFTGTHFVEEEI